MLHASACVTRSLSVPLEDAHMRVCVTRSAVHTRVLIHVTTRVPDDVSKRRHTRDVTGGRGPGWSHAPRHHRAGNTSVNTRGSYARTRQGRQARDSHVTPVSVAGHRELRACARRGRCTLTMLAGTRVDGHEFCHTRTRHAWPGSHGWHGDRVSAAPTLQTPDSRAHESHTGPARHGNVTLPGSRRLTCD
ncbi:hypothetical protein NN561_019932 [Cricetulus griseus]